MHANINVVGRLTRDPEIKGGDNKFLTFSVAVNRYDYKAKERVADYYDVMTFRNVDGHKKNIGKGSIVAISGECRHSEYETRDGEKRKSFQISADQVNYVDNFGKNRDSGGGGEQSSASYGDDDGDIDVDDIDLDDDSSIDDLLNNEDLF